MVEFQTTIPDFTSCPHCLGTASGQDSIVEDFGLRNMGNGITRVQSWCKKCRNESNRVVSAQ
jgi:hypothetical protein